MLENYNVQILSSLENCLQQVLYKIIKQETIQGKVTDTTRIKIQAPTNIQHLLLYDPNWIPFCTCIQYF